MGKNAIGNGRRSRRPRSLPDWCRPLAGSGDSLAEPSRPHPPACPVIAAAAERRASARLRLPEPHIGLPELLARPHHQHTHRRYIEVIRYPPVPRRCRTGTTWKSRSRGYCMVSGSRMSSASAIYCWAEEQGVAPEELFRRSGQPGAARLDGTVLQPTGRRVACPAPEAKGAIIAFNDVLTRAHLTAHSRRAGRRAAGREGRSERRSKVPILNSASRAAARRATRRCNRPPTSLASNAPPQPTKPPAWARRGRRRRVGLHSILMRRPAR